MKIVVLGGGCSSERDVSLATSYSVFNALKKNHSVVFIDSFFGIDSKSINIDNVFCDEQKIEEFPISKKAPNTRDIKKRKKSMLGENVLEICRMADFVFIGLHGSNGEDGKIQALLDMYGIPYNGPGYVASCISMDKSLTKKLLMLNGVLSAPFIRKPPCVIKCVHGGSSIGTYICKTEKELKKNLVKAKAYNDDVLIEKFIEGTEITVPILGNKALTPIEIVPPKNGRFDYFSKYQNNTLATEICPARISEEETNKIKKLALRIKKILDLQVYCRIDFIIENISRDIYFLEVNTLPGLTKNSLFPKSASYEGIGFDELCETIVKLSVHKKTK